MKKFLYVNGEKSGIIGKPVFKDSLGKQLCRRYCLYNRPKSFKH